MGCGQSFYKLCGSAQNGNGYQSNLYNDDHLLPQDFLKRDINIYLEHPEEEGAYTQAWIRQEDYYKIKAAEVLKNYQTADMHFQEILTGRVNGDPFMKSRVRVHSRNSSTNPRNSPAGKKIIIVQDNELQTSANTNQQSLLIQQDMPIRNQLNYESTGPSQTSSRANLHNSASGLIDVLARQDVQTVAAQLNISEELAKKMKQLIEEETSLLLSQQFQIGILGDGTQHPLNIEESQLDSNLQDPNVILNQQFTNHIQNRENLKQYQGSHSFKCDNNFTSQKVKKNGMQGLSFLSLQFSNDGSLQVMKKKKLKTLNRKQQDQYDISVRKDVENVLLSHPDYQRSRLESSNIENDKLDIHNVSSKRSNRSRRRFNEDQFSRKSHKMNKSQGKYSVVRSVKLSQLQNSNKESHDNITKQLENLIQHENSEMIQEVDEREIIQFNSNAKFVIEDLGEEVHNVTDSKHQQEESEYYYEEVDDDQEELKFDEELDPRHNHCQTEEEEYEEVEYEIEDEEDEGNTSFNIEIELDNGKKQMIKLSKFEYQEIFDKGDNNLLLQKIKESQLGKEIIKDEAELTPDNTIFSLGKNSSQQNSKKNSQRNSLINSFHQ